MPRPAKPQDLFQLKITLRRSKPPIWRRVLVPSDITLAALHFVIQEAMGWTNSHLHQFTVGERRIGGLEQDEGELGFEDERKIRLNRLVELGGSFDYEYDFGDDWIHEVKVEKRLELDGRLTSALCIAGARACPPEDVGGVGGYEDFLEALADPEDERHEEMRDWIGGDFDPEEFDLDEVNDRLRDAT